MKACRKIFITGAVGAAMVFSTFTAVLFAGEMDSRSAVSGAIHQQNPAGGKGVRIVEGQTDRANGTVPTARNSDWAGPAEEENEYKYKHRNTWNHRNTKRRRYGNIGDHPGSDPERVTDGRGRPTQDPSVTSKGAERCGYVDDNGDGINDLAPDHDGDGLPNGQDPDWTKEKRDGTGYKHGNRPGRGTRWCGRSQSRGDRNVP